MTMTLDLAEFRAWACSGNCKNVYQAHYGKHEPNCRGDEILELCDEVERLRDFDQQTFRNTIKLRAERDAAQAENERLRHDNAELALYRELDKGERDAGLAWRACADQLAARLRLRAASPGNPDREALAEYERLKGTT